MGEPHIVEEFDGVVYIYIQEPCVEGEIRLEYPLHKLPKKYRKYLK